MRVLHIIDTLHIGGAESLLCQYIRHQRNSFPQIQNYIITTQDEGVLLDEVKPFLCGYCFIDFRGFKFFRALLRLKQFIKETNINIIHSHLYNSTIIARLAIDNKTCLVSTYHNLDYSPTAIYHSKIRILIDKLTYKKRFLSIYVSNAVKEAVVRQIPKQNENNVILKNFYGVKFYNSYQYKNEEKLKLIAVGNLKSVKNFSFLINVLGQLKDKKIELDIYGDGPLRESLQNEISIKNAQVKLRGKQVITSELLCKYDVFVMSSLSEGMPISLLEAMASGLPSILPAHLGVMREVANDSALYYNIYDHNSLLNVLLKVYIDKSILKIMSKKAVLASQQFTLEKYDKTLVSLYQQLLINTK